MFIDILVLSGETVKRHKHQYVDAYDDTMFCRESNLITTETGINGKWNKDCAKPHQPRSTPGMFSLGFTINTIIYSTIEIY